MIITINLSIFSLEQRCFKSGATFQLLPKTDKKLIYFITFFFLK